MSKILLISDDGAKTIFDCSHKQEFLDQFPSDAHEDMGEAFDGMIEDGYYYNMNSMSPDDNFSIHGILQRKGNYYIVDMFNGEEFLNSGAIMIDGSLDVDFGEVEVIGGKELHIVNQYFQKSFNIPLDIYEK